MAPTFYIFMTEVLGTEAINVLQIGKDPLIMLMRRATDWPKEATTLNEITEYLGRYLATITENTELRGLVIERCVGAWIGYLNYYSLDLGPHEGWTSNDRFGIGAQVVDGRLYVGGQRVPPASDKSPCLQDFVSYVCNREDFPALADAMLFDTWPRGPANLSVYEEFVREIKLEPRIERNVLDMVRQAWKQYEISRNLTSSA